MSKDKRHMMSTDMNDMDLNDPDAMTDQERETLASGMADADAEDKKAM